MKEDKILCQTPSPGKKGTRIDAWKYQLVRKAILKIVPRTGDGFLFKELPEGVGEQLSEEEKTRLGSVSWYTTTVKLDLEVKGELERVAGTSPQRLLRP